MNGTQNVIKPYFYQFFYLINVILRESIIILYKTLNMLNYNLQKKTYLLGLYCYSNLIKC